MIFLAWVMALIATLGSLFFSEVMKLPPCSLCWYQRICMYPLVLILAVPVLTQNRSVLPYSLPLTAIGWGIAVYHNLLYYKILPESAAPCVQGISCTSFHFEWFGFITIPLLSLSAFTFIIILLFLFNQRSHES